MLKILLRGGRLTKYKGETASFALGLGISSPCVAANSAPATVFERMASALGSSVSARALGSVGLVAGLMLLPSAAHAAPDACSVAGNVVTCTGDQSAGIASGADFAVPPIDTLNVNNLTQDIAPAAGVDGVNFTSVGDITINGDTGVFAITTSGNDAEGIFALTSGGGNITVTQTGNFITSAAGIVARVNGGSGNITVTETGNITTANIFADGISATTTGGGNVTVTQTGTIITQGFGADGIDARATNGGNVTVTQTGNITTAGNFAEGFDVFADGGAGTINITTNSTIVAAASTGILVDNRGTGATNITTAGVVSGTTGIEILNRTNNSPTTINNSAAITGTGGVAINFRGNGNDTLNILPGSVINGTIDFGNGNANDVDTLNVAPGVNAVLTFADAGGLGQGDTALQSAPENTSSNVFLINGGTQAVAVDPTGFAAVGVALGSLISSIFNSIDNNASGSPATAVPAGGTAGVIPAGGDVAYGAGRRLWVSGFGGKQKVESSSSQTSIDNRFGGGITGVESGSGGSSYGVFGGYGVSNLDLEFGAGDVEVDSAFGGAYWKISTGTFNVNLAIVAGSADQDTTRNVSGVNARGESDGWFFSPSITVAAPMEFYAQPVIFSARVSYAGLFLDGYTETGVANPLTVGDRDVHILNTRAQVNVPYTMAGKDGSGSRLDLRAGVDAQFDAGSDKAALVVGGTPFSFSTQLDDQVAGFIGTTISVTSASGMFNFSASGEVQSTFDGGYQAVGEVRAAVNF